MLLPGNLQLISRLTSLPFGTAWKPRLWQLPLSCMPTRCLIHCWFCKDCSACSRWGWRTRQLPQSNSLKPGCEPCKIVYSTLSFTPEDEGREQNVWSAMADWLPPFSIHTQLLRPHFFASQSTQLLCIPLSHSHKFYVTQGAGIQWGVGNSKLKSHCILYYSFPSLPLRPLSPPASLLFFFVILSPTCFLKVYGVGCYYNYMLNNTTMWVQVVSKPYTSLHKLLGSCRIW